MHLPIFLYKEYELCNRLGTYIEGKTIVVLSDQLANGEEMIIGPACALNQSQYFGDLTVSVKSVNFMDVDFISEPSMSQGALYIVMCIVICLEDKV